MIGLLITSGCLTFRRSLLTVTLTTLPEGRDERDDGYD
jgi:hypothetical protein